mmetsp:Transcript_147795/g.457058  ORF Transcript_147795/g.457058 Transcript_147795/m.457058 type:complete len:118 (+) Transcript_147795:41-394(+)
MSEAVGVFDAGFCAGPLWTPTASQRVDANIDPVIPGFIHLGGEPHGSAARDYIRSADIRAVINVTTRLADYGRPASVLHVRVEDSCSAAIRRHFDGTFEFLEQQRRQASPVFVHCEA